MAATFDPQLSSERTRRAFSALRSLESGWVPRVEMVKVMCGTGVSAKWAEEILRWTTKAGYFDRRTRAGKVELYLDHDRVRPLGFRALGSFRSRKPSPIAPSGHPAPPTSSTPAMRQAFPHTIPVCCETHRVAVLGHLDWLWAVDAFQQIDGAVRGGWNPDDADDLANTYRGYIELRLEDAVSLGLAMWKAAHS